MYLYSLYLLVHPTVVGCNWLICKDHEEVMGLDKNRIFLHNRSAYLPVSTAFYLEPAIPVQDVFIVVSYCYLCRKAFQVFIFFIFPKYMNQDND